VVVGYHAETDRVLLNEVNQKRYPHVWVETPTLWKSLCTKTLQEKPRGLVLVSPEKIDENLFRKEI